MCRAVTAFHTPRIGFLGAPELSKIKSRSREADGLIPPPFLSGSRTNNFCRVLEVLVTRTKITIRTPSAGCQGGGTKKMGKDPRLLARPCLRSFEGPKSGDRTGEPGSPAVEKIMAAPAASRQAKSCSSCGLCHASAAGVDLEGSRSQLRCGGSVRLRAGRSHRRAAAHQPPARAAGAPARVPDPGHSGRVYLRRRRGRGQ